MIYYDDKSIVVKIHPWNRTVRVIWATISIPMLLGGLLALYNMTYSIFFDSPLQNIILGIIATTLLIIISFAGLYLTLFGGRTLRFDAQTRKVSLVVTFGFIKNAKFYSLSEVLPPSVFFHEAAHDEDTSRWGLRFELPGNKVFIYYPVRDYPELAISYPINVINDFKSAEQEHLAPQRDFSEKWRENINQLLKAID